MADFAVAHHEAAHAVADFALRIPLIDVSIRPRDGSLGRCRHDPNSGVPPGREMDFPVTLVVGGLAERFALGREPWYRSNWFHANPDSDEARAADWIRAECRRNDALDELDVRAYVQLRARSLVFTWWKAIEAVAAKLEKDTTLVGEQVVEICKREGVRRLGEGHPISREEAMAKMTPRGRRALIGVVAPDGKSRIVRRTAPTLTAEDLRAEVAEVDRQIDKIKAQLMDPGDDPALWPLRKRLVSLYNKRRELLGQLEGGTRR